LPGNATPGEYSSIDASIWPIATANYLSYFFRIVFARRHGRSSLEIATLSIYTFNPLIDRRWNDLVDRHPRASAFHQQGWLQALAATYGYEPYVLTSTGPDKPLEDGIVLCRISSWLTGTRSVSLPFADHCEPLLSDSSDPHEFTTWLHSECDDQRRRYSELRPLLPMDELGDGFQPSRSYCFHQLDLRPSLERIFQGFHKDCVQRRIRHAEREGVSYEVGRTAELLDAFYHLLMITRRRHRLLPQPRIWFRNLIDRMNDNVQIRLARKNGVPIASMITLRHKSSVIYKYGCSDEKFHHLGVVPFMFWKLIEESKGMGIEDIDFGRSGSDQNGLITFKNRFGATRRVLTYYRYSKATKRESDPLWRSDTIRQLSSYLPDPLFSAFGGALYKHVG
jgi:hypothetical protein